MRHTSYLKFWFPCCYLTTSLLCWKWRPIPPWRIILIGILTYFLLFFPTSIFEVKASAMNSTHVFHRAQNVWKWSPVCHCANKMFWKMLVSSHFLQNNAMWCQQPMRITTLFLLNRDVHLSARNPCIKF